MTEWWKRIATHCEQEERVLDWSTVAVPAEMPGFFRLSEWLQAGFSGSMEWMANTQHLRAHPREFEPSALSALMVLWPMPAALRSAADPASIKIAAYAQGEDYHHSMGGWLHGLAAQIRSWNPDFVVRPFVDAQPLPERELAQMAGLGWIGKNRMLIHPKLGSGFLIGGLLCSFPSNPDIIRPIIRNSCGACSRCVDACPSQAIDLALGVDARKCNSALTIEYRGNFTPEQTAGLGNWLFGCDICQAVCPWNQKHLDSLHPTFWPATPEAWEQLLTPGNGLRSRLRGTPLDRAGRKLLARNFASIHPNSTSQDDAK